MRQRDATSEVLYRFRLLDGDQSPSGDGTYTLIASTDEPCRFNTDDGPIYEVLSHRAQDVDTTTCRALLLNHDPNQIAGNVTSIEFQNGRSIVKVKVNPDAKLATGVRVGDAIKSGALRGVSIGYNYDSARNASYDSKTRTVTVTGWRWSEVTLTPIPRDGAAHVMRSLPDSLTKPAATPPPKETAMDPKLLALIKKYPARAEVIATRAEAGEKADAIESSILEEERTERLGKIERENVEKLRKLQLREDIRVLAESHGERSSDYIECESIAAASKKILEVKAQREQERAKDKGFKVGGGDGITVTRDQADKIMDAVEDSLLCRADVIDHAGGDESKPRVSFARAHKDLGMRRKSFHDLARLMARAEGREDVAEWEREELAGYLFNAFSIGKAALGRSARERTGQRASANQTTSMFSNLLINVMDKALFMGFQGFENTTYQIWCKQRMVMDFKQFAGAELTLGNLSQTAEGAPFPELSAADVGYKSNLNMWGGTLTLSFQDIYNDDLGEFFSNLGKAGSIAKRTIDRQVYVTLLGGSWTNDTTSGQALANSGALDSVRSDFRHKKNPVGQYMGNNPAYVLHPLSLDRAAQQATGRLQPPGEQNYLAGQGVRSMTPVEVVYLDDSTITGNSTTNYYVTGDPGQVDTMVVALLQGMPTPQVMEYDAGAAASRKFKIFQPFVPVLPTYVDSSSNTRIPGIQKGTP